MIAALLQLHQCLTAIAPLPALLARFLKQCRCLNVVRTLITLATMPFLITLSAHLSLTLPTLTLFPSLHLLDIFGPNPSPAFLPRTVYTVLGCELLSLLLKLLLEV